MKQLLNFGGISKKYLAIGTFFFFQSIVWAQEDQTIDVNLNVDGGQSDWYAEPWVMVVGAAVFIIIIVALLRGKSSK
ncbi:hypothetical protein [uncultured Flavobacterium sp.]|uniref:hypothetical protein n=1 Tax=uncultured Flavobacterium sp. TaxID=165435 RepID=UPI0030ED3761|tara:strand:+ start:20634 stop:20864 length:231 start_codon:yes stop_codon:yes gene_type:complete